TRSADEIAEELDSRGIALTTTVTRHVFSIWCTCLAEDFEDVLALMGDVLMSPTIPESELTIRKGEVVTSIRQDEDNPAVRAAEGLVALLYPDGHPYGQRAKGTVEVVAALTRERLLGLHRDRFAPGALIAVVVGDLTANRAQETAARIFGAWQSPPPAPVRVAHVSPATARRRLVIPMPNKAQTDVAYGFVGITRKDRAFEAFRIMNNVFGEYAIGGRLGDSIRERQGMAYYVFSALDANVAEGPLIVRAGVSPANVDRTIASIDEQIARVRADGFTEQEVRESVQYLV